MTASRKYNRFQDIPPFIEGTYRADIPMNHIQAQLQRYTEDPGLDLDPDYQRVHVWTPAQQEAFVEHLLRGGRNNVIRFNSVNWHGNAGTPGPVQLVDGKQRLAAILMFLENRLRAFGSLIREYEGRPSIAVSLAFIINDLPDRASVLRWYLEINEGNVAHTPAELEKVRDMLRGTE